MYGSYGSDLLKHCPWCGNRPEIRSGFQTYYNREYEYDFYQIFCSNRSCRTHGNRYESIHKSEYFSEIYGVENPKETAIIDWNAGNIILDLHVVLPDQHYTQSKIPLPSKYSHIKPAKMQIIIPKKRGIDDKFRENMSVIFNADGTFNPYRFWLAERWVSYAQTKLLNIVSSSPFETIYQFQCDNTCIYLNQENKTDTSWLKQASPYPPINDKVFEILSKEVETLE